MQEQTVDVRPRRMAGTSAITSCSGVWSDGSHQTGTNRGGKYREERGLTGTQDGGASW